MSKYLVIVESPTKAKTINKYLGKDYVVMSSTGHIRDLPSTGRLMMQNNINKLIQRKKKDKKAILVNRIGIDPWNEWKANYQILPGKEKIVSELQILAQESDHIYLATDRDREGEAIAWHLREVIGGEEKNYSRIVFNEITKNSICKSFANPVKLNMKRVHAQQARRFIDRVVGYMISSLLWKKVSHGLSAGRVQSVAVRLVVERELEIKNFIPQEYWNIDIDLCTKKGITFPMQITHQNNKAFYQVSKDRALVAINLLKKTIFRVSNHKIRTHSSKPKAPFITSTLQQAANIYLSFGVKKTMVLAQLLYELGYITYIRTDSTNLSQDAIVMARRYIERYFGKEYLPKKPNIYSNKEYSQEAHEAIRPSDITVQASHLKTNVDAQKLYHLIWKQFVACQMVPAQYTSTILTVTAGDFKLQKKACIKFFDGWTKVVPVLHKNNTKHTLSKINIGEELILQKINLHKRFTKLPERFSEASLVQELERRGIGRPSTYASIIASVQDRGYVRLEGSRLYAEKIGEIVNSRLKESFQDLMNYNFTARMEDYLDKIAKDQIDWKIVLNRFFYDFKKQLEQAEKDPKEGGMQPNAIVMTSIVCPVCNRRMGIRVTNTGVFLICSGYALPKIERCQQTINLIAEYKSLNFFQGSNTTTNILQIRNRCKKCDVIMDSYLIDKNRKLHVCSNSPNCKNYEIEQGKFCIRFYDIKKVKCNKYNSVKCM